MEMCSSRDSGGATGDIRIVILHSFPRMEIYEDVSELSKKEMTQKSSRVRGGETLRERERGQQARQRGMNIVAKCEKSRFETILYEML